MKKIIEFAHFLAQEVTTSIDTTVDMTVGNGNDTMFLSSISKKVYGFDIQEIALQNTNKLLNENNITNVKLYRANHQDILKYVDKQVSCVLFNLGYLPGGSKLITTKATSTIKAINDSLLLLKNGGRCIIVIYPGHLEGYQESVQIEELVSSLDQHEYDVIKYDFINQKNDPPYLIAIEKKIKEMK